MRAVLGAGCGGALYFLAWLGFGVWPLIFVFLVPLWGSLERLRSRSLAAPAGCGLVFGAVAYAGGHTWLWRLVDVFLDGSLVLGALLWGAHALWFAAGFAAYGLGFALLRRRNVPVALAGSAPLLVLEWLQPQLFPVHAGSALIAVGGPAVQLADLGGPLLLTACVALGNACVFEGLAWARGRRHPPVLIWGVGLAVVVVGTAYGVLRVRALEARWAAAPRIEVGIVQANLGLLEKTAALAREAHETHLALSRELQSQADLDLVVWPETAELGAIRGPLPVSGHLVREGLAAPLLFGGTLLHVQSDRLARSNAAFLVGDDDMIRESYAKNLLIPLAESVPFEGLGTGLAERLPHAQEFVAAAETPPLTLGPWRVSTPICYEIVRPGFVRRMVADADPHLLVTLANDAWFGDSQEPWMHLQLARLRAVEHRRYLVRATNSGISAIVDPAGRIVARTGVMTRETLRGRVALLDGTTIYGRVGDWPGWLASVALLVGLVRRTA